MRKTVDKEAAWEQKKQEMSSLRKETSNSFSIDSFLNILQDKDALNEAKKKIADRKKNYDVDKMSSMFSLGTEQSKIDDLVEEDKFDSETEKNAFSHPIFSNTKENKEILYGKIESFLDNLSHVYVAKNTKEAYKDNFVKALKVQNGLKVVFSFDNKNVSVTAIGKFSGEELICINTENGKIIPLVIKITQDEKGFKDLTHNYNIDIA